MIGNEKLKRKVQICIDQGNSSIKAGIFAGDDLIETFRFDSFTQQELVSIMEVYTIQWAIISSVTNAEEDIVKLLESRNVSVITLSHQTKLPFVMSYKTPETLGKDRIAAVAGAWFLKPNTNLLIIDAGTAITYDFIDSKANYYGGNIVPGIDLRLKSLHVFTDKLPKVEVNSEFTLLGQDTKSAIINGVMNGVVFEINGYFDALKIKYPELSVFLTGGSAFYFERKLKSAIFAERNLVLIGLNRILLFNVHK